MFTGMNAMPSGAVKSKTPQCATLQGAASTCYGRGNNLEKKEYEGSQVKSKVKNEYLN
jgi:hypothetical protein